MMSSKETAFPFNKDADDQVEDVTADDEHQGDSWSRQVQPGACTTHQIGIWRQCRPERILARLGLAEDTKRMDTVGALDIGQTRETNAKTFSPLMSVSDGNGEWALAMKTNDRISTTIARIANSPNFSSLSSCTGSSTKAPCAVFNWRNLSIFFIILILNSQTFFIGADVAFTHHSMPGRTVGTGQSVGIGRF